GVYEIFEIVPSTVNASNYAVYIVSISNVTVDSVAINQNEGSGYWVSLGRYYLPAAHRIEVKVIDTGKSTEGVVLRADAIKIALIEEITEVGFFADNLPTKFKLEQNFPNPFNSSTVIRYSLPEESKVKLKIFNTLGQEVATIVDEHQVSGTYSVQWSVSHLSSGVYLYQLKTDNDCKIKKLMIIK
ncbi:MAG: T9SS type A sorting domain-containing protein, partial [Candidatus Marinimicrobia bacterium]|nr:T9SS type A sorting domain-containing protein [Candidatus Neomarinimicrobiota bacterium]